ncbi:DsrE family protein [bacterium]|nr:DsrE family protein [bacterium]
MLRRRPVVLTALLLVVLGGVLGIARAASPRKADGDGDRAPRGKLVFVVATGLEDSEEMTSALRDAKLAQESGFLGEVDLLFVGRGVQALSDRNRTVITRAERTAELAREARAAGVRIVVCQDSLDSMRIASDRLDPRPDEVVPSGIAKLAELVSRGFAVIRY